MLFSPRLAIKSTQKKSGDVGVGMSSLDDNLEFMIVDLAADEIEFPQVVPIVLDELFGFNRGVVVI